MTQSKGAALYAPVPVAVHMWFADGAGWAFHPDISDEVLEEIIRTVSPVLYSTGSETGAARVCKAGLLVFDKIPQDVCADPSAAERSPQILRVAMLSESTWDACSTKEESDQERLCAEICRQLSKLSSPSKRGRCEPLLVWASAQVASVTKAPDLNDAPVAPPPHAETDDLTKENRQLKQEVADLRRDFQRLRRTMPTGRQRLVSSLAIVLITALLTAAGLFLAGMLSWSP